VVAFGQFLARPVRELPSRGYLINAHASLLPKLRGAAPIARAILDGESETGISVMKIEREMDAGPVARTLRTAIDSEESCGALSERLGELAADAIALAIEDIASGTVTWTEQDAAEATLAPKIDRADAELDWREPADALALRVRAMAPKPGAVTSLEGQPLRVLAARCCTDFGDDAKAPGTAARPAPDVLCVATGDGWLELLEVQRAGGKKMPVAAFLRGRDVPAGARLGTEDEGASG
jgi:methionyl-tRNA formyltransferase